MLLSSSPALYHVAVQHAASLSSRRDPNATPVQKSACQVQVVVMQCNSMEQSFGGRARRISWLSADQEAGPRRSKRGDTSFCLQSPDGDHYSTGTGI